MDYWTLTLNRAHQTLTAWKEHLPALRVGGRTWMDLETFVNAFHPMAMAVTTTRLTHRHALHAKREALAQMKNIGIAVPAMIEAQLSENAQLMHDLGELYQTRVKTEETTLKRLRNLLPIWLRANAALAALTPPQPELVRVIGDTAYTVALAQELLDGFTGVVKAVDVAAQPLNEAKAALLALKERTDDLNKRWYKLATVEAAADSALAASLRGITTERSTPAPKAIEIDALTPTGESDLQVRVAYVAGGGRHATTRLLKWMVEGVDGDFTHSEPLTATGNTIGPFVAGQVVKVMTEVSNSVGTRTSAVRTITLEPPV